MVLRTDPSGRVLREGAQVEIGGNERYVSVCRLHFKRGEAQSSAAPPPAAGGG
jgi:thymidine kinase